MSRRSALGQVRGLGSAKEGTGHWWSQRLSSLALVPLSLWFMLSLVAMAGADHATIVAWIASPIVAGLLILLVTATFFHAYLGLQVVIEDYVHGEGWKLTLMLICQAAAIVLGLAGVLSILMILFRG